MENNISLDGNKKSAYRDLTMKKIILLSVFCALIPAYARADSNKSNKIEMPGVPDKSSDGPKAPTPAQQGSLPEVIIKGGEKSSVRSEKPLLDMQVDLDDPALPTMEVEEDLLNRQPESLRNPRAGFSESLANQNTILPARIRLAKDPVKVFYPLREIMAISPSLSQEIGTGWEMAVTDTEGHSLRKFSGKGLPPAQVAWNGRSERAEIINVGKSYSTVITYRDTRGQIRNFVGEPFSFDGVIHQESKGLIISLSIPAVFEPKKGFVEEEVIGDSGTDLLQESADWIKRYFFTYPIRVECYSKDANQATSRAQGIAKSLGAMLLLPRGEISANGAAISNVNFERIDIVIANR